MQSICLNYEYAKIFTPNPCSRISQREKEMERRPSTVAKDLTAEEDEKMDWYALQL